MNRMSERELPKLQGVGNRLIADVTKPSHVADEIFCLVVPTDGANCCFLDSQSHRIFEASTCQQGPVKQAMH